MQDEPRLRTLSLGRMRAKLGGSGGSGATAAVDER